MESADDSCPIFIMIVVFPKWGFSNFTTYTERAIKCSKGPNKGQNPLNKMICQYSFIYISHNNLAPFVGGGHQEDMATI